MMMQPTQLWDFPDRANLRPLNQPWHWTIDHQRPMRAPMMVILAVPSQKAPEMSLVYDNHVVQAVAADTPDEPFDIGILPRIPGAMKPP